MKNEKENTEFEHFSSSYIECKDFTVGSTLAIAIVTSSLSLDHITAVGIISPRFVSMSERQPKEFWPTNQYFGLKHHLPILFFLYV